MFIAEFTLSTPILRDALGAAPGTTVDLERTSGSRPTRLSILARGQDLNRFEDAMACDESVQEAAVQARGPAFGQYEVTLTPDAEDRTTNPWWQDEGIEPMSATGSNQGWSFRMRFPTREALSNYRDLCRDRNVSFTLHDLYARETLPEDDEHGFVHERPGGADAAPETPDSADAAPDTPGGAETPTMGLDADAGDEKATDDD